MTRVAICIEPASHHFFGDKLFDDRTNPLSGDDILAPYKALRAYFAPRGVPIHTSDRLNGEKLADRVIYCSMGMVDGAEAASKRADVVMSAYFAMECPIVEPKLFLALPKMAQHYKRIMSWSLSDDLTPFTKERVETQRYLWPQSYDAVHEEQWARGDRKFMVMINSNKLPRLYVQELYTKRLEAVQYFEQFGEVDLYGPNWNRMPNRVGRTWVPYTFKRIQRAAWEAKQRVLPNRIYAAAARAWKGTAKSKSDTLSQYTWALCFENMIMTGWMTEKMFDCLFAGTIPVYWGAPDIDEFVPKECYVDMREHADFASLRAFLKSRTPAQIQAYRDAGRAFIASKQFDPFRKQAFVDLFRRLIKEDAGVDV